MSYLGYVGYACQPSVLAPFKRKPGTISTGLKNKFGALKNKFKIQEKDSLRLATISKCPFNDNINHTI